MATEVPLRVVLIAPPAGVAYGIQHGKGNDYTTILTHISKGTNLEFEFTLTVKDRVGDELPNFLGPLSQGPVAGRFVYVDIGKSAGQVDSCWQRRIKVPLGGITWELIGKVLAKPNLILEARLPGTGKDGGPSCATLHPIDGWKCCKK
ncbi:MAG: DUF5990 family protein [Gemmataceae bacterium]